ncbi:MAG: 50S ribosomal protein L4 [Candidatus Sungbacteria bacterium RIFCSPLOWO2_12_FULL_41_11]|uniref:Large ribosomal subunit protein uL4 n=1 Tax=Candidatus Sungbacteria bacterium RIFCSPLOWO2_12_FULL_41_11 TaxID=1802286 RepID=A0A1G2LQK2_9BACT|nr:MAG: 50S ribosomal protein L4 [Parcubacteria group bacterium GW2011_GWA2_42_14]OGZ98323.1 MAG: 50S ribosomal protein L4 [Candidatus Sungbacteria bacterium RIFCSPHIGHO2_02_FULL_41_12b]OHA13918.1 MAG: 50S ribosomal protein L4 [Candidatus Sungbacteria bacterium RIFCSPLOWO2_12_FULL_41_11]
MKVKLYNQVAEEVGKAELPDAVFGLKWNADLVHQVVTSQEANRRPTVAHAKGRSEVRGGGRKPWRQKGTGRARHGSIRSPIWKGGGVTHGPLKEKSYKKSINKKMAKKALYTVLSAKARDGEIVVLDTLKFEEPKTKLAAKVFKNLEAVKSDLTKKENRVLVLLPKMENAIKRAIRNLPYTALDEARNLNALQAMKHKYILFTKESLNVFKS